MYEELTNRLKSLATLNVPTQEIYGGARVATTSAEAIECIQGLAQEAADAIETMREMVATAYEENANIIQSYEDSKPRWSAVTERLPEIGTYIIAGRMKYDYENEYTHFVDVAYFGPRWNDADCSWQTFNDWWEGQQEFEITHWQPLPEPPEEE